MLDRYILSMRSRYLFLFISPLLFADTFLNTITAPAQGLWAVGAKVKSPVYKDAPLEYSVAPYIFGSYGILNIEANRADITLYGNGYVFASIVGRYRSQEARDESSPYGKRKAAIELGAQAGVILPLDFVLRAAYLFDVSNAHKGSELDIQLFRHDHWGDLSLLSTVALQHQSSALSNYYYATDAYSLSGTFSAELELIVTYTIGTMGLFVGSRNYFYSQEVRESLIVGSGYNLQVFTGVGYQF